MQKRLVFTIVFTIVTLTSFTQNKPNWIKNKPTPTNSTYRYVVEWATGESEIEARNFAIGEVFRSTAMRIGQPFDSENIFNALQKGTDYSVISRQFNIPINKVCEYSENDGIHYRVYILCQVAEAGNITVYFDNFNDCYNMVEDHSDDWRALGLSVFPGLGQIIVKKNKPVGYAFMIGDLALIGGGVYCLLESNNQYDISQNPNYTSNYRQDAYDNYKMLDTSSKILFGAAAAVYVINLYTAYKMPTKTKGFAFAPKLIPENNNLAYGIGISYNF
jgi:hypothetical protein